MVDQRMNTKLAVHSRWRCTRRSLCEIIAILIVVEERGLWSGWTTHARGGLHKPPHWPLRHIPLPCCISFLNLVKFYFSPPFCWKLIFKNISSLSSPGCSRCMWLRCWKTTSSKMFGTSSGTRRGRVIRGFALREYSLLLTFVASDSHPNHSSLCLRWYAEWEVSGWWFACHTGRLTISHSLVPCAGMVINAGNSLQSINVLENFDAFLKTFVGFEINCFKASQEFYFLFICLRDSRPHWVTGGRQEIQKIVSL